VSSSNLPPAASAADPGVAAPPVQAPAAPLVGRFGISWNALLTTVPIYVGLVIIWLYFDFQTAHIFHSPRNISNMLQQYSYKPVLALGVVLVLLLGEIDLSLGYLTLLSIAMVAWFDAIWHWPTGLAIAAGVAICTLCGLAQGFLIAFIRMPAFVVTLGGFLIFEGIAYSILGGDTIRLADSSFINNLSTYYLPNGLSWLIALAASGLLLAIGIARRAARTRAGLTNPPITTFLGSTALPIVAIVGAVWLLNNYQGVPISVVILGVLAAVFWFVTRRLRYGRHIYAVGGNQEAARRAGINTTAIRWSVFGISGLMAGVAGVMLLGYGHAASTTTAGPDLLLDVISIAVIGGVSLTGGKGSVWSVLLGGLVIASVDSGLNLQSTDPNFVYVIKGTILLLAILIDVLGKRRGGLAVRR